MKKTKWIMAALAAGALALAATGCDNGFTDAALNAMKNNAEQKAVAVEGVDVSPATLALITGDTARLTAEVTPKNASNKKVDWSSSDDAVATVDADGTVTAAGNGTAYITATTRDGGLTATCRVTVSDMTVTLNMTSLTLVPGDTVRLEATVRPASAAGREVAWESSNESVATVDGGTVTAMAVGTAVITARVGSMAATCEVTVKELSEIFVMDGNTLTKYNGNAATVVIPDGVTKIDGAAFYENKALEHVTIPGSVGSIGNTDDGYGAFEECTNLKSVTIGEGVTYIGQWAFYDCESLMSVTIPASMASIRNGAFSGCSGLTEVHYTGTLADWCGISWGNSAANPLNNGNATLYIGGTAVTNAVIPDSVTAINAYAFYGYRSLASVTMGKSVASIRSDAFSRCNLTDVNYTGSLADWCAVDGLYELMSRATTVNVGGTDLKAMTTLEIPAGVTHVKGGAFYGCKSLTSVTISGDVQRIGVSSDSYGAFEGCTNLKSVTIGTSVTRIDDYVFYACASLETITYEGTTDQWESITKGSSWNSSTGEYTIQCTDGTVAKDGTVTKNEEAGGSQSEE